MRRIPGTRHATIPTTPDTRLLLDHDRRVVGYAHRLGAGMWRVTDRDTRHIAVVPSLALAADVAILHRATGWRASTERHVTPVGVAA